MSRFLMDRGKHSIAIDILAEFWERRKAFAFVNNADFKNEVIAYFSTHLFLVGELQRSRQVLNEASTDQFGVPVCLRVRANVLLGDFETAEEQMRLSEGLDCSPYSKHWAAALITYYRDRSDGCLKDFEKAAQYSMTVARSFAGFIRFDYINALLDFSVEKRAESELGFLKDQLVEQEGISSLVPYYMYAKALSEKGYLRKAKLTEMLREAIGEAKKCGDWFVELMATTQLLEVSLRTGRKRVKKVAEKAASRLIEIMHELRYGIGDFTMPIYEPKAYKALILFAEASGQPELATEMRRRLERVRD